MPEDVCRKKCAGRGNRDVSDEFNQTEMLFNLLSAKKKKVKIGLKRRKKYLRAGC